MASQVEQIKERLSIHEVIGTYIKLEKAGANFKARCPFHNEKTPSFFISPSRSSYYCFGCGAKGDIFTFVQEFEGVDFMGSLKTLAERAGVVLTRENPELRSERERLYACLESATIFYQKNLYTKQENADAVSYLLTRGLTKETIKEWRIGFAEDDWRRLMNYLRAERKFSAAEMEKVGLIKRRDGSEGTGRLMGQGTGSSISDSNYYDRFRSRIMFPIFDSSGRVIAFSGRIFESHQKPSSENGTEAKNASPAKESSEKMAAKYLNSPETELFHKSEVLYGFHVAKRAIREKDCTILVEGQMDMLMSQQAGFKNTVAVSGTALTAQHLGRLQHLSNKVLMAFDPDSAGIKAAGRSAEIALSLGMEVRVVALPKGEDPALFILNHPDKWQALLDSAVHIVEFTLSHLCAQYGSDQPRLAKEVNSQVLPFVASIQNAMEKSHFISLIHDRTGFREETIWQELKKVEQSLKEKATAHEGSASPASNQQPQPIYQGRKNAIERKIVSIIWWQESLSTHTLDVSGTKDRLVKILHQPVESITAAFLNEKDQLILEAEISYNASEHLPQELDELFVSLEEDHLKELITKKLAELSLAERTKDAERAKSLLQECKDISDRLDALPKLR